MPESYISIANLLFYHKTPISISTPKRTLLGDATSNKKINSNIRLLSFLCSLRFDSILVHNEQKNKYTFLFTHMRVECQAFEPSLHPDDTVPLGGRTRY